MSVENKVSDEELQDALAYLENFEKSVPVSTIDGSEKNGGETTVLTEKYTEKLRGAESNLNSLKGELLKAEKSVSRYKDVLGRIEKGEKVEDVEDDEPDEKKPWKKEEEIKKSNVVELISQETKDYFKKSQDQFTELRSAIQSLITLQKSNAEKVDILDQKVSTPVGRRSAENIAFLQKSQEAEPLDDSFQKLSIKFQKSQVSNELFKAFEETKDSRYADAVSTFESSGFIPENIQKGLRSRKIILTN